MKYERKRLGDVTVLEFSGEFDAARVRTAAPEIDALVDAGEARMVFDLGGLGFMDSTALGYLLKVRERCREAGGDLVLARPSKFFRKTIRTLDLREVFVITESAEEGAGHFTAAG